MNPSQNDPVQQETGDGGMKAHSFTLLESVLDSLPDSIRIVDEKYAVIYANHAAAREAGRPLQELIGAICYGTCYGLSEPCSFCHTADTFNSGKPHIGEGTHHGPDGTVRFLEVASLPIMDASGNVTQVIEISRDVTDRVALERHARRNERLAAAGELAAGMAHEIRNPLGSIVTAANLLNAERGVPLDDDHITLLEVVKKEARRLNTILTDFLSFARPREPKPIAVDLNRLITETMETLKTDERMGARLNEDASSIRVDMTLDPLVGTVHVDPDQIKQVLWNVIVNGLQAIPREGILDVSTARKDRIVEVRVTDTGVGIPPERIGKVFEPFFSSKSEGSGLGMPIAQHIVNAHQGDIQIESKVSKGTQVIIRLPVVESMSQ